MKKMTGEKQFLCMSRGAIEGLKPVIMMVTVQAAYAGMNIFYKMIADSEMSLTIIIAYRNMFAAAVMFPLAHIFERKSRPKLTFPIILRGFISGLLGATLAQNLYIESLALTTPTIATAVTNLIPAITFVIAICFRVEKLALGTHAGRAKVVGTVVGIGGTMLFTFYKGKEIPIWSTHINLIHRQYSHQDGHVASSHSNTSKHMLGVFLALCSSTSVALWLNLQAKLSKIYPCQYSSTALMSIMASIQSVAFALCKERDWSQWKLGWDIRLLTAAYTGVVATGLVVTVMSWCVRMRGPLFVSSFNPLCLLLVAISGSLLLHEKFYLGSILGAVLIVLGLYMVLWGKSKEMIKMMNQLQDLSPSHPIDMSTPSINSDNNKRNETLTAFPISNASTEETQPKRLSIS